MVVRHILNNKRTVHAKQRSSLRKLSAGCASSLAARAAFKAAPCVVRAGKTGKKSTGTTDSAFETERNKSADNAPHGGNKNEKSVQFFSRSFSSS